MAGKSCLLVFTDLTGRLHAEGDHKGEFLFSFVYMNTITNFLRLFFSAHNTVEVGCLVGDCNPILDPDVD